ncbi:MAG TPA: hypothetical protein PLR26_02720 [Bacilli bacterium]|nr:hypothetical protein [Bacilli bacterium]
MKKIILFIAITLSLSIVHINNYKTTLAFSIDENDETSFYDLSTIDANYYNQTSSEGRLFKHAHKDIYVYQLYDRINYLESGYEVLIRKISTPQKTLRLSMRLEGYYFDDDFFLVWGKKRIGINYDYVFYKYDNSFALQEEVYLTNVEYASFTDVIKINGFFYFCGGASGNNINFSQYNQGKTLDHSDAVVMIMNADLERIDMWIYGGTNHERFTNIEYHQNNIVLIGEKSSVAPGDFENIGQMNQEKVMLVSLSLTGEIQEAIYFDHNAVHEFSNQLVVHDSFAYIHIYVEDLESHYVYKINLTNFEIEWGQFTEDLLNEYMAITHIIIGNENTLIIVGTDIEGKIAIAGVHVLDGDFLGMIKNPTNFMCSSIRVEQGLLKLYGDNVEIINNKTEFFAKEIQVDHYHIDKNVDKICSNVSCPLEDTSHIQVSSWFGYPVLQNRTIQGNFSPSVHGTYEMDYYFKLDSQKSVHIESNIVVPFYANIIEGGIYGVGYKPIFTGMATLNNEPFLSGRSITQPGNYQLAITNHEQESTVLNFRIENGILYSGDQNTIWNIACEKGDVLEIKVSIHNPDKLDILNVYINNTPHQYYELNDTKDELIIDVLAPTIAGIHHITISKIEYDYHGDARSLIIDAIAIINVLKTVPSVQLIEENSTNKMIQLKALFSDVDQAIINVKAILYENDNPIRSKEIHLNNADFNFEQLRTNTSYKATILISYNLGDHIRHVLEMVEIQFTTLKEHISIGNITITKKGLFLEEAIIQFSKTNTNLLLSSVKVDGKEMIVHQPTNEDNTIYYIVSGVSVFVLVTTYFIIRSKKKMYAK